ncbi:hypothetical protein JCM3770_005374 [Rhodotorula araucariae]
MLAARSALRVTRAALPLTRTLATAPLNPPSYNPDGTEGTDPGFRGSTTRIANLDERSVLVGMALAGAFGVGIWYVNKDPEARKEYERVKEGFKPHKAANAKE